MSPHTLLSRRRAPDGAQRQSASWRREKERQSGACSMQRLKHHVMQDKHDVMHHLVVHTHYIHLIQH